jgi:acetyltransferase-like isoleucine patch superfamily enzyme
MSSWLDSLRGALRRFLGLGQFTCTGGEDAYRRIAREMLNHHTVFGDAARVKLGKDVILNDALINTSSGTVTLGDYAFCGHGVCLLTGHHDYTLTRYARQAGVPQQGRDIVVGAGTWIGSNATVLGPCTIGDDAVIAAGSVVTGAVESGWVYGGVPARPIKRIKLAEGEAP